MRKQYSCLFDLDSIVVQHVARLSDNRMCDPFTFPPADLDQIKSSPTKSDQRDTMAVEVKTVTHFS